MSGMAGVLDAHWSRSTHSDSDPFVDKCDGCGAVIYIWGDDPTPGGIEPLAAHQAAMLAAAGYGPVKEAGAKALEEAAVEIDRLRVIAKTPYAECAEHEARAWWAFAEVKPEVWLRARAAAALLPKSA